MMDDYYRVRWGYCGEHSQDFPYTVQGLHDAVMLATDHRIHDAQIINLNRVDGDDGLSDIEKEFISWIEYGID